MSDFKEKMIEMIPGSIFQTIDGSYKITYTNGPLSCSVADGVMYPITFPDNEKRTVFFPPGFSCEKIDNETKVNDMTKNTISYNQTEHIIQNYLIRFTHQIDNKYSEIESAFVIKGADVTKENALEIANILFKPPMYTNIKIVSIENDENTLTPTEYEFIRGKINDLYQRSMRYQEISIKNGTNEGPLKETEYDTYLKNLIDKMSARMRQFPVYHT